MGDLIHAGPAIVALASALLVSAAAPQIPNDRIVFIDIDPQARSVERTVEVPGGFTTAVASWNVVTPSGSSVAVDLRARIGERWTAWYTMGVWSADGTSGRRRSVAGQKDADASVDTDTLTLNATGQAFEVRLVGEPGRGGEPPALKLLAVATSLAPADGAPGSPEGLPHAQQPGHAAPELDVPERTQRIASSPDAKGGGGDAWCSPASVSMVMAYWARTARHPEWDVDVQAVADGVYDPVYDGCGNWPFNVAFASEHGLAGFVRQLPSLDDVALLLASGVPVIASIAVKPGELDGSPYKKTEGHLLVIRGFNAAGDVIVNDPYGLPGAIRRVYRRDQFTHVWQAGSNGTVYVIAPPDVVRSLR